MENGKTLGALLLALIIGWCPAMMPKAMAQKAKKTQTTKKKPASKGGGSQKKAATPASTTFEGALLYRNCEYHSSLVRKYSNGRAYNGERTMLVKMKGQDVHILDEAMHLHTIVVPGQKMFYLYSDVLGYGLTGDNDLLQQFFGVYDPNYQQPGGLEKTSTLKTTDEKMNYKGDNCRVYRGQLKMGDAGETDVELWFSPKYKVSPSYKYVWFGVPVGGIVRKGIISNRGSVPLLGKLKSTTASELIALTAYKVPAAEMQPPANIRFSPLREAIQLMRFYEENTKALKKQKLYPKKLNSKDVKYSMSQEWDFAEEWLAKKFKPQHEQITWAQVGQMLFDTGKQLVQAAKEIHDIWDNKDDLEALLPKGRSDLLYVGGDMAEDNDLIPIDQLIARLEQQAAPYRQELATKEAKAAEIASRPKEKKIINGKVMYLTSKKNLEEAGSLWEEGGHSSARFTVAEWDRRIKYLRTLQSRGQTHISKDAWYKYIGMQTAKQKKAHEDLMDKMSQEGYDRATRNAQQFKGMEEYDLDYARSLRDYMRKEREASTRGIRKSKYEEWLDDLLK